MPEIDATLMMRPERRFTPRVGGVPQVPVLEGEGGTGIAGDGLAVDAKPPLVAGLQPGERHTVSFTLTARDMALLDRNLRLVVEPGTFTVQTGDSSDHTQSTSFRLDTPAGASVAVADTCERSQ